MNLYDPVSIFGKLKSPFSFVLTNLTITESLAFNKTTAAFPSFPPSLESTISPDIFVCACAELVIINEHISNMLQ
ncbi:hypothetical protein D3C86_1526950 [compost metagenome]